MAHVEAADAGSGVLAVQIVTPEQLVWSGPALMVVARGAEGELGVLPRHSPLITRLVNGPVTVHRPGGGKHLVFGVASGFLEVKPDRVTVLADAVELPEGQLDLPPVDAAGIGGENE